MKRHTFYVDENLVATIKEMGKQQGRSLSYMISSLLQLAIREKQRKRSAKDKVIQ